VQNLVRGEAQTLDAGLDEGAVASQISAVDIAIPVYLPVVLVDSAGTDQPEVRSPDEPTPGIFQATLRFHVDLRDSVQDSHDRLPRRPTAVVEQGQSVPEAYDTRPLLCGDRRELTRGALAEPEGGVPQHHQIEKSKVPRGAEKCFSRRGHRHTLDQLPGWPVLVLRDQEAPTGWALVLLQRSDEKWLLNLVRQPPAAVPRSCQVGEGSARGQNLGPRPQVVGVRPVFPRGDVHPMTQALPAPKSPVSPNQLPHAGSLRT